MTAVVRRQPTGGADINALREAIVDAMKAGATTTDVIADRAAHRLRQTGGERWKVITRRTTFLRMVRNLMTRFRDEKVVEIVDKSGFSAVWRLA